MTYSVLIADDHALIRQGVKGAMESDGRFKVLGDAEDGIKTIVAVRKKQPDILVLDIAMPYSNGIEVIGEVRRWSPNTKILILTGLTTGSLLRQASEAGAQAIYLKSDPMCAIIEAAACIAEGRTSYSSRVSEALEKPSVASSLTPREGQVLQGLLRGEAIAAIAQKFAISVNTVDKHRASIMRKFGVHSSGELMALAHREGFLESAKFT
mgnify:CR=1 FL=1